jgi:hypothetical protein
LTGDHSAFQRAVALYLKQPRRHVIFNPDACQELKEEYTSRLSNRRMQLCVQVCPCIVLDKELLTCVCFRPCDPCCVLFIQSGQILGLPLLSCTGASPRQL